MVSECVAVMWWMYFLGTGLGARSYAVIEQGMIGRIVESSPMQLREFIEEGAGVSRYQARRAETEKKNLAKPKIILKGFQIYKVS